MPSLLDQLYKTKVLLVAVLFIVAGFALVALGYWLSSLVYLPEWFTTGILPGIGTTLVVAGGVSIFIDYRNRKENMALLDERLEHAIEKKAPAIRDAVLDSFAFDPDALKNVASNETLDRIAANALGLRLGDQELAQEVYTDVRDQVISSPERWHDVDIDVSLSPWTAGPTVGRGSMFVATIRWEYKVVPAQSTMRFACVADMSEYRELLRDPTVASAWHFDESGGVDPTSQAVFEVVQLSVNGKEKKIRRTERPGTQLYTVGLGKTATDGEKRIAYTFRVLAQRHSHLLYLDLPRPTKSVHVRLNYGDAGIRRVNTLDYFASNQQSRLEQTSADVPAKTIDVGFDGWVFPRSGVAFVWVLEDEQAEAGK
jgi:hypothetical protein